MRHLPLSGAMADGTFNQTSALLAARTLRFAEKPLKTLEKFREREAIISWKAMGPPMYRELAKVVFYFSQGFQKIKVVKWTCIA